MIINKIILGDINSKNAGSLLEIGTATCQHHMPVYSSASSANAGSVKMHVYRECRMIINKIILGDITSKNAGS